MFRPPMPTCVPNDSILKLRAEFTDTNNMTHTVFFAPTEERWLRLIGQVLPVHKWRLAVWAYAADGCADRFSQYTQSGVRPSRARCGLR